MRRERFRLRRRRSGQSLHTDDVRSPRLRLRRRGRRLRRPSELWKLLGGPVLRRRGAQPVRRQRVRRGGRRSGQSLHADDVQQIGIHLRPGRRRLWKSARLRDVHRHAVLRRRGPQPVRRQRVRRAGRWRGQSLHAGDLHGAGVRLRPGGRRLRQSRSVWNLLWRQHVRRRRNSRRLRPHVWRPLPVPGLVHGRHADDDYGSRAGRPVRMDGPDARSRPERARIRAERHGSADLARLHDRLVPSVRSGRIG